MITVHAVHDYSARLQCTITVRAVHDYSVITV